MLALNLCLHFFRKQLIKATKIMIRGSSLYAMVYLLCAAPGDWIYSVALNGGPRVPVSSDRGLILVMPQVTLTCGFYLNN